MPLGITGPMPLWVITLLGLGSFAALVVAVWRKWKNGSVADDSTLIERLNADNKNLRANHAEAQKEVEDLRRRLWYVADCASLWRRQLQVNGIVPKGVPNGPEGAAELIFEPDSRPEIADVDSATGI